MSHTHPSLGCLAHLLPHPVVYACIDVRYYMASKPMKLRAIYLNELFHHCGFFPSNIEYENVCTVHAIEKATACTRLGPWRTLNLRTVRCSHTNKPVAPFIGPLQRAGNRSRFQWDDMDKTKQTEPGHPGGLVLIVGIHEAYKGDGPEGWNIGRSGLYSLFQHGKHCMHVRMCVWQQAKTPMDIEEPRVGRTQRAIENIIK